MVLFFNGNHLVLLLVKGKKGLNLVADLQLLFVGCLFE